MLHKYLLVPLAALLWLAAPRPAQVQTGGVGIGTTAPDASAALYIVSTGKRLLPCLTTTQPAALVRERAAVAI